MIPSRYVPSEVVTGTDQQIASGIYEFPAREYNGDEGRWPSPDPAGFASVNPADPQTWNRYAYVRNSPLGITDPTGMGDDWGGANGEDPYCLEDFCANGMPDYYGNDYNANDWVQTPDSGFGCMWNGSINTLRCPTNDCVPSTDAFGCASFYGPQSVSPSPQTPGFTLSVRQPGQTFSACMAANSGNYSISGTLLGGHAQAVAGNDIANLAFGNASEGTAGLFFSEGGSRAFAGGVGTVMTAGRRTASITSLNLEGVTGPAPMILRKTGAEVAAEWLSGIAELKLAADAGLTGAEAIGCAIP